MNVFYQTKTENELRAVMTLAAGEVDDCLFHLNHPAMICHRPSRLRQYIGALRRHAEAEYELDRRSIGRA